MGYNTVLEITSFTAFENAAYWTSTTSQEVETDNDREYDTKGIDET